MIDKISVAQKKKGTQSSSVKWRRTNSSLGEGGLLYRFCTTELPTGSFEYNGTSNKPKKNTDSTWKCVSRIGVGAR